MSKCKPAPEEARHEPTISYNRTLRLDAPYGGISLGHMRQLMQEALDKGFASDAEVRLRSGASLISSYESIEVSDKR